MGLTIDSSVYIDSIVPKSEERHIRAKEIIKLASESGIDVFEPRIFIIELVGVLSRSKPKDEVKDVLNIAKFVNILSEDEIFETAINIAFDTHCRAVDAYFITTAKLTNSVLITNDRIMATNAKKYDVEAYYLIEEFNDAKERLRKLKS